MENGVGSYAFEYLLSRFHEGRLTAEQTRSLIDRFANLRNADGTRACRIEHHGLTSPLIQAVTAGDVSIVRILLDLRNADGSHALDVNLQLTWVLHATALDVAYFGSHYYEFRDFVPNPEIPETNTFSLNYPCRKY